MSQVFYEDQFILRDEQEDDYVYITDGVEFKIYDGVTYAIVDLDLASITSEIRVYSA